jgi:hypothetical protein
MLSKPQLIEFLVGVCIQEGSSASPEHMQKYFNNLNLADLQKLHADHIQKTTSRALAAETTRELEEQKLQDEQVRQQREWHAQQNPPADPKENRRIFSEACRKFSISENEANLGILVRAMNGDLFDSFTTGQTIEKMRGSLCPPTPQELATWSAQAQEAEQQAAIHRQKWLREKATPAEIRDAAHRERTVSPALQNLHREICLSRELDLQKGVEPKLPATWNDSPLTADFVKRAGVVTYKNLISRYGNAAITALNSGVKHAEYTDQYGKHLSYDFE